VWSNKVLHAIVLTYLATAAYFCLGCFCCGPFFVFTAGSRAVFGFLGSLEAPLAFLLVNAVLHGLVTVVSCRWAIKELRVWHRANIRTTTRCTLLVPDVTPALPKPRKRAMQDGELADIPAMGIGTAIGRPRSRVTLKPFPPLGSDPMRWKELYAESGLGFPESMRALGQVPFIIGLVLIVYMILVCGLRGLLDSSASA